MTSGYLDNPSLLWIELMMEHVTFGATGCGPSNRSDLLVSAANICCDSELWDIPSIWDTSSVAGTWCFLDVEDCTLPILADVRVDTQTFVAHLPGMIQHHQCRVLELSSRGYGGAMANPAQTEDAVNADAVARVLTSKALVFLMTARLGFSFGGLLRDTNIINTMFWILSARLCGECRIHGQCDTNLGSLWIFMSLRRTGSLIGHLVYCLWMDKDVLCVALLWRLSPCLLALTMSSLLAIPFAFTLEPMEMDWSCDLFRDFCVHHSVQLLRLFHSW